MDSTPPPYGQPPQPVPAADKPASGVAIASLVLGIASFFTCGLTAIPAVICGHIGLSKAGRGESGGSGLAIAGLVMGYLMSVIFLISGVAIMAGIALPVFGEVQERGKQTQAMAQLKSIRGACQLYAKDHDNKYPGKLEDLVPDYLPDQAAITSKYPEPGPFEYYGAAPSDPPEKIVAATAHSTRKRRVVLHYDGSAEVERTKRDVEPPESQKP